ncbi:MULTISPECIES: UvrB/UvrC motif-containing protein [Sphingosinicellaceae]|uniref:UvrB/UvrC motif-containing protein n=1 Tax=Sphingosinicellaceae TaxID=2820280 RepID=UPI001C1DF728|nr:MULTISPECIES: UvrB/UvrC motif-containing protein [Polymorphobacter]QYE36210.1 UvrB/UvrC motif-containing protein [Polymorphobacter sp. PAMC 29334]UAJ10218.1 UvrB/UvrC motif-containing protein [Polymorphobacter megasporae]
MATNRETLERQMREAAAAGKFELAAKLRDDLKALADVDTARETGDLYRQQPGAMGLGSSRQAVEPPPGWVPPKRPDPMTANRSKRRR